MCLEPLPRLRGCETIDSGGHPLPPLQRCYENQIFFPKYEELEELESRCAEDLPRHQGRLHFQAGSRGGGGVITQGVLILLCWTLFFLSMMPTRQHSSGSHIPVQTIVKASS